MKEKANDSVNWNTLFLRSDTVISATSKKLNVSKIEIMDPESDNMAVKLAMAETNIINETKKLLEEEGVCVERFQYLNDKNVNRSENVILVKNLPFETTTEEIRILFGKFGQLGRVVLPPSRALALIEFLHQQDAKKAFSSLAYKSFKYVPLFLEWPPLEIFKEKFDSKKNSVPKNLSNNIEQNLSTNEEISNTIYIKNLNFSTTEDTLRKLFLKSLESHLIKNINVVKKTETKGDNKGSSVSLGYGFVELSTR
jgi:multiple RNA-binding domain-containing protein 1